MAERLAIIRDPRFGVGDRGTVVLSFAVHADESKTATVFLDVEYAVNAILAAGVTDVRYLDGRACWVTDDGTYMAFVRMAAI